MSGSQHNPNGRQSQLGSGWSPLQVLQMANLLARAPQAHMASDRGVTWHTPTPPPHLYHVPAPSPPDPLQAMKGAGGNSVFRHTATPPELYRHTPTPPDKHMMRHTPSPGDVKTGPPIPPDLYQHLGPARDKLVREELLAYARGVDLSLGSRANGATAPPAHPPHSPALSVRDAPTINSLIARSGVRRVDSLLERLSAAPPSPHSVIVHPRVPSPPSSNEDSLDSCGAPTGSKRKRKPERTVRVPAPPPPAPPPLVSEPLPTPTTAVGPASPPPEAPRLSPPAENGVAHAEVDGPPPAPDPVAPPPPPAADAKGSEGDTGRRKTRSGSAETIADIAAMIADGGGGSEPPAPLPAAAPALSVDKLKSVLASPEPAPPPEEPRPVDVELDNDPTPVSEGAGCVAPRRLGSGGALESPSEAKPAEGATAEPCSFVEVENQLEKMFAGLEEPRDTVKESAPASKRRKSGPGRGRDAPTRRKGARKKQEAKPRKEVKDPPPAKEVREGYDSGSNASSGRSRGPYIQIRGPRASPVSVCVMNAATGEEEERGARRGARGGRGERGERRRGLHASTLGLRYDAATRDASWLCAFCQRGPHARALGDLFGPYPLDTDLAEYRALDEPARRRYCADGRHEAWLHAECGVWAPGVVAAGARIWGLARAVWTSAAERCRHCTKVSAPVACAARGCLARAHLPCARAAAWRLDETDFRAMCPLHRPDPV